MYSRQAFSSPIQQAFDSPLHPLPLSPDIVVAKHLKAIENCLMQIQEPIWLSSVQQDVQIKTTFRILNGIAASGRTQWKDSHETKEREGSACSFASPDRLKTFFLFVCNWNSLSLSLSHSLTLFMILHAYSTSLFYMSRHENII